MNSFGYDPKRLKRLKPACALIDTGKKLGTGFLVGENRLLTCDHVMTGADTANCRFGDDHSKIVKFRVVSRHPELDSAVLEACDPTALAGIQLPTMAPVERNLNNWWGWGFPAHFDGQSLPMWGCIGDEDSVGPDKRHAIQLFAENLVGSDAQLGGLSGSPALIQDDVFGMIYRVFAGATDGNRAQMGMIYAIPINPAHPGFGDPFVQYPPNLPPVPTKPTEQEWEQLRLFEALKNAFSPRAILKVVEEWNAKGSVPMPANVPYIAAEKLLGMGAPESALMVLEKSPMKTRSIQLSALAHSLLGQHDKARGLIAMLEPSAESGGIAGGIFKRRYFETGNRAWLWGAFEEYESAFRLSANPYPGINAAATALWLNEQEVSRAYAAEVHRLLETTPENLRDHWYWASLGEACMLSGDTELALRYYGKAVARAPSHGRDIAVMRRQARRNLEMLKVPPQQFESVLAIGGVACFTGHRVDDPGRKTPRFPRECVGRVALRIREVLDQTNVRFGFSSAAGGADILFIEQLLACGGEPTVFLPFPAKDFAETSVGSDWLMRFNAILEHPGVTIQILDTSRPTEPALEAAAYARCNARIQEAAVDAGRIYDEEPMLIAVLHQGEEGKVGGTADAVRQWKEQLNGEVILIDTQELALGVASSGLQESC